VAQRRRLIRNAAVKSGWCCSSSPLAGAGHVWTLQQLPHFIAELLVTLSSGPGSWLFLLLSILVLIVMGSVLEERRRSSSRPLLMPVARPARLRSAQLWVICDRHGIGLFAPPLGVALRLLPDRRGELEETVRPVLKYLGISLPVPAADRFVPGSRRFLPRLTLLSGRSRQAQVRRTNSHCRRRPTCR